MPWPARVRRRLTIENDDRNEWFLFNFFSREMKRLNKLQKKGGFSFSFKRVNPPIFVSSLYDAKERFGAEKPGLISLQR